MSLCRHMAPMDVDMSLFGRRAIGTVAYARTAKFGNNRDVTAINVYRSTVAFVAAADGSGFVDTFQIEGAAIDFDGAPVGWFETATTTYGCSL